MFKHSINACGYRELNSSNVEPCSNMSYVIFINLVYLRNNYGIANAMFNKKNNLEHNYVRLIYKIKGIYIRNLISILFFRYDNKCNSITV